MSGNSARPIAGDGKGITMEDYVIQDEPKTATGKDSRHYIIVKDGEEWNTVIKAFGTHSPAQMSLLVLGLCQGRTVRLGARRFTLTVAPVVPVVK